MIPFSIRLYRWLVRLYPPDFHRRFGPEMITVFQDLCHRERHTHGQWGVVCLWLRVLPDLVVTAGYQHWSEMMRAKLYTLIGAGLLLLPMSFITMNVLQYQLGFSHIWNPYIALYETSESELLHDLLDLVMVSSPVIACTLLALPYVRWTGRGVQLMPVSRASRVLITLCVLIVALFTLYVFAENWACLIGQQARCDRPLVVLTLEALVMIPFQGASSISFHVVVES